MGTATAAKERPILFSGPMVQAILAGRKTQTRRVVKPQPDSPCVMADPIAWPKGLPTAIWPAAHTTDDGTRPDWFASCPYGKPGDRLWVRESWRCNHLGGMRLEYKAGGACLEFDDWPKDAIPPYAVPGSVASVKRAERQLNGEKIPDQWRPSIHMPRWASRIALEITGVRVDRLDEISGDDAIAEGVDQTSFWRPKDVEGRPFEEKWWDDFHFWNHYPQIAYRGLWESINGEGSWAANPWVWVVSFSRVEPQR